MKDDLGIQFSMSQIMQVSLDGRTEKAATGWGLRTFSWSCFLYGQPLACSVFYRAFPAQRLFDPRMVVPADVLAGEVDDLLARAFLPMPGIHGLDLHTVSFVKLW